MSTKLSYLPRAAVPAGIAALLLLTTAAPVGAGTQFSVAQIYVELNDTDGDLGLHALIDGGPYQRLEIESPDGQDVLTVSAKGALVQQGLTELFFESAEPSFDEVSPKEFFARFPAGRYEIEGTDLRGRQFRTRASLSHVLAAPPEDIFVGNLPAAPDCDGALPTVGGAVIIDWEPVSESHPDIGDVGDVVIGRYQFFVEQGAAKFAVDLPADITEFMVPPDFLALGGEFKFEIIARTDTGNNTAIEGCFIYE